ncbi:hypothetical protein RZN22_05325 [Bacillaceae bacterium S4-13-58]
MRNWRVWLSVIVSLALFFILISQFLIDEDKLLSNAEEAAKEAFLQEPETANQDLEEISLYLPEIMQIEQETPNNLIVKQVDQLFLLFFNPLEDESSTLYYDSAKEKNPDPLLLKKFEDGDRVGYLLILKIGDSDLYEVQTGIGGKKMTSQTESKNLVETSRAMMEIIRSIKYK